MREHFARLGDVETVMVNRRGRLRGGYRIEGVPRGRYEVKSVDAVLEDPFGLERVEVKLPAGESILVYPRLVDLDGLFSDSGARALEGRRLLLRRPTGFDLHSVRDYEQGESLRRVHWPSTAKRGHLMVKELEDAPRDETAVLLDADAGAVAGVAPDSSFELQVRAAGSILRAHASRGRRAALIINSAARMYQPVHTFDGEWLRAFELLAAVEPDGPIPCAAMLADEAGHAGRALDLTVVTASLSPRLVDRLLQRMLSRHSATLVYVDRASFSDSPPSQLDAADAGLILRLERGRRPCRGPPARGRSRRQARRQLRESGRWLGSASSTCLASLLIASGWLRLEKGGVPWEIVGMMIALGLLPTVAVAVGRRWSALGIGVVALFVAAARRSASP